MSAAELISLQTLKPLSFTRTDVERCAMAAASVRLAAPSLPRMFETCTLAVFGEMNSSLAISLLLLPVVSRRSTSRSRLVSAGSGTPGWPPDRPVPLYPAAFASP
jgi:hypothetical protein